MNRHRKRDETLGKVLRAHPDYVSMSQVAYDLGRHLTAVSREVRGWTRPNAKHRQQWVEYLSVPEGELFPESATGVADYANTTNGGSR